MKDFFEQQLKRYRELESRLQEAADAANAAAVQAIGREHALLGRTVLPYLEYLDYCSKVREAEALRDDPDLGALAEAELEPLRARRRLLVRKLKAMGGGEPDPDTSSVILEIRAATGGEEAGLFARDLFDMYRRWSDRKGWKIEVMSLNGTDLGGLREITFSIRGEDALRELRFESGGHRVQRVPTTETQGRVHTSAATVAVLPEPKEIDDVPIRTEDIQIDTFSASGPGGQHVNKTQSAVRITHIPSGMVATCQDERSQHKNKDRCLRILRSRLYEWQLEQDRAKRADQRRTQIGSGSRTDRIRTYNFPQNRVTDHRANLTLYNLDYIIAGNTEELVRGLACLEKDEDLLE